MRSHADRLNDYLEAHIGASSGQDVSGLPASSVSDGGDADVRSLVALAQQIQTAPALKVDSAFAEHLERRLLAHNQQIGQRSRPRLRLFLHQGRSVRSIRPARSFLIYAAVLIIALVVSGAGTLFAASRVADPAHPLYQVKRWEQQVQQTLSTTPQDRVRTSLQIARDHLDALSYAAHSHQYVAYQQELNALVQDVAIASQTLTTLPAGQERDDLADELARCRADTQHTLRRLLPSLQLAEQLTTTSALGHLGERVSNVEAAEVELPYHLQGRAMLRLKGVYLTAGAQLLFDHHVIPVEGKLQGDTVLFVIEWHGQSRPHTLGLLNPDGTGSETTSITFVVSSEPGKNDPSDGENGNGNGTTTGNEQGQGNEQQNTDPSGNGQNGDEHAGDHGKGTPPSNKPTRTPVPVSVP